MKYLNKEQIKRNRKVIKQLEEKTICCACGKKLTDNKKTGICDECFEAL